MVDRRKPVLKRLFNVLLGNWVVSHAARVIALSHFEVSQFSPYKLPAGRIIILPNGIAIPKINDLEGSPTTIPPELGE